MVVRYTGAVKFKVSQKVYEGRWRVVGVDGLGKWNNPI